MEYEENEIIEITGNINIYITFPLYNIVLELKIKCPSDILIEYSKYKNNKIIQVCYIKKGDNKAKIFFEFKPNHNKYTLKKTKGFLLDEINTFKNQIVHFFNISIKNKESVYIYLEIDGKKIKMEKSKNNYYKLVLNDIKTEKKKKINCIIIEDVELKFLIRIINNKIEKENT